MLVILERIRQAVAERLAAARALIAAYQPAIPTPEPAVAPETEVAK